MHLMVITPVTGENVFLSNVNVTEKEHRRAF